MNIFMFVLGGLIVLAFFATIAILVFFEIPQLNEDLLNISIGAEISAFTGVVMYFYGSSKGSADKNEMLHKSTPTP